MTDWMQLEGMTVIVRTNNGGMFPARVLHYSITNKSVTLKVLDYDGFPIKEEIYSEKNLELLEVME